MPGVVGKNGQIRHSPIENRNPSLSFDEIGQDPNMKGGSRNRYPNGYNSDQMSDGADESPRYSLEHLATFSVGSEFGLVSPKDGLRRLLQMEKSNGVWTQKMQMKLDKNWILILDYEEGDVVEKFPMSLISDPTAYTSEDSRELYNNILIFIVRADPKNHSPSQSEMHIFQCSRVYAQEVVDEIKMYMSGKVRAKNAEGLRHLPPPPMNPPPDPPVNGNSSKVREQVAMFSSASSSNAPLPPPPRGSSVLQQRMERAAVYARESNDETSSTASDKYEREVNILNHCFDDIERFVVRLQHAAAAYKELERRQKSRKHKKKDMGDGMLSMRAKTPPEREFMDVLQKFKLSFNLLAKLKSHIHDPNAPELVHFLFTPLALIVDAARDPNSYPNLTANIISPLLTRDAIELLTNCCTSKETDLWHSLGDSWMIPRNEWKGYESNYRPVFANGWAPENPLGESPGGHRIQGHETDLRDQDYQRVFGGHPERDSRFGSEYFGSERGEDPDASPSMTSEPHPLLRQNFERPYDHMPPEARRDFIERGRGPENDFGDPRDRDMRSEFSNDSIERANHHLSPERQFDRLQMQWLDDLKNRHAKIVQVVYPRTANNDKELTVIRGEILEVIDDSRKWWKARNMQGQVAHVPHTIITSYPSSEEDGFNNPVYGSRNNRDAFYSTETTGTKDAYLEEGTTRSQEASASRPAPGSVDWVRQQRQGKSTKHTEKSDETFPTPPPEYCNPDLVETTAGWLPPPPDFATNESPGKPTTTRYLYSREQPESVLRKTQLEVDEPQHIRHQHSPQTNRPVHPTPPTKQRSASEMVSPSKQKQSSSSKRHSDTDALERFQEELRNSIAQKKGQKVWRKITCPEHGITDCYYIASSSPSQDVQHWLMLKGFSERATEILKPMSADLLFNSQRTQLEKYLGEEGAKLHSLLIVQKNMSGYKTCTSKELNQILAERRQKADDV